MAIVAKRTAKSLRDVLKDTKDPADLEYIIGIDLTEQIIRSYNAYVRAFNDGVAECQDKFNDES